MGKPGAEHTLGRVSAAGPQDTTSPAPGRLALTWLGHATVLLEMDGQRVITDPLLRRRVGPFVRVVAPAPMPVPVGCALVSHLHPGHADLPTLRTLARTGPLLVPSGSADWLSGKGITDIIEMVPAQTTAVGALAVRATPARHDPRRRPLGPAAPPLGFLVQGTISVYFLGSTKTFAEMADLRGRVDVALVSVADCRLVRRGGQVTPEDAAAAVALIDPAVAVPIHWGTMAFGGAPSVAGHRSAPAREFAVHAHRYAPHVEVRILEPTQRIVL